MAGPSNRAAPPRRRGRGARLPSTITLALWRLRRTWGLLFVTCIGMIAAVVIVCTVPLYSGVAMTAGLRGILTSTPQSADIAVHSTSEQISSTKLQDASNTLNNEFQTNLGAHLGPSHFSIETQVSFVLDNQTLKETADQVQLVTEPIDQAAQHGTLLRGRYPQANPGPAANGFPVIEVALTPKEAQQFKVDVNSTIITHVAYILQGETRLLENLTLRVVGIFTPAIQNSSFWHAHDFQSIPRSVPPGSPGGSIYTLLASSDAVLAVFDRYSVAAQTKDLVLEEPFDLYWFYRFDPSRVTIDDLDAMVSGVNTIQVDIANVPALDQAPFVEQTSATLPSDLLSQYRDRVPVASVPVYSLLVLVVALVLFFVSMMADLLVDRQAEAVSVLRSRGASRSQVFGSFVTQSIGIGLIALIIGPFLAILLVDLIARGLLPQSDQSVLHIITDNPLQVALGLGWYALATTGIAVIAMIVSINRATRSDVLAMRREAARATQRPLWLRLNLDLVAVIVMVIGYGFSQYLTNSGVLDTQTRLLLQSPLILLGSVFLLIACILLFLRIFPYLLTWGARFASRNRGVAPLLALAQMSRAPRQSIRMTLLLAFATAFAIFSLVFISSQGQRVQDLAAFQAGADFSGQARYPGNLGNLQRQTAAYNHIPGVLSASLGNTTLLQGGDVLAIPIELRAVDSTTFANAAIWTSQDSSQSLKSLMTLLAAQRPRALTTSVVPAIVDANAASALHLSNNGTFTLNSSDSTVNITFVDVAEVAHIPTVSSSSQAGPVTDFVPSGGVLVDYQTYAAVYAARGNNGPLPLNYVWLHTHNDASSLASVRSALMAGRLAVSPLFDRQALIESLNREPLFLDLLGVLAIGATTALLLALMGNLIASWLSARSRLTNFAVMRALGTSPRQVASVLTWEQSIIYTAAILLGVVFGGVLSALVVPVLVFTGVPINGTGSDTSSGAFYVSQSIPPIQVVVSPWLIVAIAVLVVICAVALGLMVRVVSQPSISQTLRLNED